MDVSENSGTPKSSILIGFSIINHPFWGTSVFGNTHILSGQIIYWLHSGPGQPGRNIFSRTFQGNILVLWPEYKYIIYIYIVFNSTYVETIASRLLLNHVPSMLIIWFQSPGSLRNDFGTRNPSSKLFGLTHLPALTTWESKPWCLNFRIGIWAMKKHLHGCLGLYSGMTSPTQLCGWFFVNQYTMK